MEGGSSSRVNIVILDACRTNRSFRSFRSSLNGLSQPRIQPVGSIIAFSTAPGTVAYDGEGRNSPYVSELSKHLLTPGLKIEDISKLYVNRGPGSFAGIRNSLAVVKGIYVAKKIDYYCFSFDDFDKSNRGKYEKVPNLCEKLNIKKNLINPIYLS